MNNQSHHPGGPGFDRERELDEQRHRALQPQQPQDDMAHREREQAERKHREPYHPAPPHHSSAGSIPIHQPVASRIAGAIHSPGGLLANHGGATSASLGGPSGSSATFGGPLHGEPGRPSQHGGPAGPPSAQHQMFSSLQHGPPGSGNALGAPPSSLFGGPIQQEAGRNLQNEGVRAMQQMPFGPGMAQNQAAAAAGSNAVPQGQQPILNDALSYLDQVKVQFHEQPDVYNRFLDIMKDFKSQTIDTPGVISRVSELFAGHPNLIQGFNTFLPPGYRIECGLENNPNSIRVTTPSGSTIHSIGGGRAGQGDPASISAGPGSGYPGQRSGSWQPPLQHGAESPEATFTAPAQNGPGAFPPSSQSGPTESSSPNQQRAVPVTQNGGAASNHGPIPRNAHTPTPTSAAQAAVNGNAAQANMSEKRGPVEFNHAISYVNKIKNRFQDKPEIYKQFLEILQTYQREQKPIQDVYSQVTTLFHTAPDLLEDFKQFLPESAAQTRSGQRAEDGIAMAVASSTPQPNHSGRDVQKMPPVGNFAPPASQSKESKKRPRNDKTAGPANSVVNDTPVSNVRGAPPAASSSNKRAKLSHKADVPDGPVIEPTLTPVMPKPLGPTPPEVSYGDDINFFEKVKKHLGNRASQAEFMKLLNMFIMDLITKDVLMHKASQFIGSSPDLMAYLKQLMDYRGQEEVVENRPEPPTGRVSLSNCRGYGPSYRLLPKREHLKRCSGRDELCNSVLNDRWASHPTWASEDSGFVAHRKNAYEEGLHRIEEERHDYDFYIEANQKCIQLLEPIAQQMLTLSPAERQTFRMPPGLGGQSTSIYKRVLKKIYGPDKGADVVNEMFANPFSVVPIVMARLKQKDEEWRFTQREWEKVWQAQTDTMYLKSLDHMGIQVKSNDKRNLSAKHLVDAIKTKYEEQRRKRAAGNKVTRYQWLHGFGDEEVLLDALRFMFQYGSTSGQHNMQERRRILDFFDTFIPRFFDLPEDKVEDRLAGIDPESAGEDEEEDPTPPELTNGRTRRNARNGGLLRGVLDPGRNGSRSRQQKEDTTASGSKETTPDVGSANEEEMADAPEDSAVPEVSNDRWLPSAPRPTIVDKKDNQDQNELLNAHGELKADAPFPRSSYNFYCNQTMFVFFSVFHELYRRLNEVKSSRDSVTAEIRRQKAQRPAVSLGMVRDDMRYFEDEDPEAFWPRTVELIEDFISGEVDETRYQDVLRHYYLENGWKLYTIQDLLKTLCRLALSCNNQDAKGEKTKELVREYLSNRHLDVTSYQDEISARKFAEKCIKDGEMFVIGWHPAKKEATVRWLQKDETTFYMDEMELQQRWQYYISSYMRIENTEGIKRSDLQKVVLGRNLPTGNADSSDDGYSPKPLLINEGLILRICLNSSKIVYEKGTSEYFIYNTTSFNSPEDKETYESKQAFTREMREEKFRERMVMNSPWMKNLSQEEVQGYNEAFQKWAKEGISPPTAPTSDVTMTE